jgi:hypothetical protein
MRVQKIRPRLRSAPSGQAYPYYPPKLQRRWALHHDTFPAPLTRRATTLTGAIDVRQLAEQPIVISGPLGGIAIPPQGLHLRFYLDNYISFVLSHLDSLLIKFLDTTTTFNHLPVLSHLYIFFTMTNHAHLAGLKSYTT